MTETRLSEIEERLTNVPEGKQLIETHNFVKWEKLRERYPHIL